MAGSDCREVVAVCLYTYADMCKQKIGRSIEAIVSNSRKHE